MMARTSTFQNKMTITLPRKPFVNYIVYNENLNKTDLRVYLHLLTHLDADEYKAISKKAIAKDLGLSKGSVEDSIDKLVDEDILSFGGNGTVKSGYKFCF